MPIIWMAVSIAALAILAQFVGRRVFWTVVIGVLLFVLLTLIGSQVFRIRLTSDYSVLWFSIPAILLALMFGPRRSKDTYPPTIDDEANAPELRQVEPEPYIDEKAFQQWLAARGLLDRSLTPEELQDYRRQAAGKG